MGLDNGFSLRNIKTGMRMDLLHFRKYYELADFFRQYKMLPKTDGSAGDSYMYAVTEEVLDKLQHQLEPIYNELIKLPTNTVAYYDENGYPAKYVKLFYSADFDPTSSQSAFAGTKLLRLYQRVDALKEILDNMKYIYYNEDEQSGNDWDIIFYDSY